MPGGSEEVSENRFRSRLGFRLTITWLEKALATRGNKLNFEPLVELPDVVAMHGESRLPSTPFFGINVSEFEGSVWIFFIPR